VARQVLKGGGYDYNREFSATAYTIGYNGGNWTTAACNAPTWARPSRRWPRASCST
jgi:hypothetical protein